MLNNIVKAFVEGRGSMASLERAIEQSPNPLMARAEMEREFAAEWALKNLFATIPPPSEGLSKVMSALRSQPAPQLSPEKAEDMKKVSGPLNDSFKGIPEPAGGFSAAIARLKAKLAATPTPKLVSDADLDITPCFDAQPAAGTSTLSLVNKEGERKKSRRVTQKIVRMPQRSSTRVRDVLAAGKDLPENPNDVP